jgi:hypothetical protein
VACQRCFHLSKVDHYVALAPNEKIQLRCSALACWAGENDIPGLTDEMKPRSRGPKRASRIRQLYNLTKEDDVRTAAKMHGITKEKDGKKYTSTVKIQRLITPTTLQRKRRRSALKKAAFAKVCLRYNLDIALGVARLSANNQL